MLNINLYKTAGISFSFFPVRARHLVQKTNNVMTIFHLSQPCIAIKNRPVSHGKLPDRKKKRAVGPGIETAFHNYNMTQG